MMAKILLVEDDINLREIYAARLSAEGYELVVASDGEEALSKAVAEKPNLILLDVMMPKISGFDVLDILRSTPETKATKVIILSALSQQSDRERGERLGADKYLVKSQITLEDVVETVKNMVEGGTTSIVTASGGRLPGAGLAASATDDTTAPDDPSAAARTNDSDDDSDEHTNAASDKSPPPTRTAEEIAGIDTSMQGETPINPLDPDQQK